MLGPTTTGTQLRQSHGRQHTALLIHANDTHSEIRERLELDDIAAQIARQEVQWRTLANTLLFGTLSNRVPHDIDLGRRTSAPLEEDILMALALGTSTTGVT